MDNDFVTQKTCDAVHNASEARLDRVEKDIDKQWDTIEGVRKAIQKQAIYIATIVGGISAIVQLVSLAVQFGFKH